MTIIHAGDQAVLHSLIVDGKIDMEGLEKLSHEELVKICEACQISTLRKSKVIYSMYFIHLQNYILLNHLLNVYELKNSPCSL
jgi:hypothetical protein